MIQPLRERLETKDVRDICRLIHQLSPNSREKDLFIKVVVRFKEMAEQEHTLIVVKRDLLSGRIIGMASLICFQQLTGFVGQIEDVVVDKRHRKQGIGEALVACLIEQAKEKWHVKHVDLTSNPTRTEANALYQKMGFQKRDTNAYRLKLG